MDPIRDRIARLRLLKSRGRPDDEINQRERQNKAREIVQKNDSLQNQTDRILKSEIQIKKTLGDSKRWFRETMNTMLYSTYRLSNSTPNRFYSEQHEKRIFRSSQIQPGSLYCWFYNPKYRNTLPYFDRFPVGFIINMYRNGFLGINLHYLPVRSRAVLMTRLVDNMLKTSSSGEYLDLQYRTLADASRYAEVKPCIKRYLITQIQGQMIQVPPDEWMKTIFLPLENFQKRSSSFVWQQSKRISMRRPYD